MMMNRSLPPLMVLGAVLMALCCSAWAQSSIPISPGSSEVLYVGRFDFSELPNSVAFDWSGVNITFTFTADVSVTGISVGLQDHGNQYNLYISGAGNTTVYFVNATGESDVYQVDLSEYPLAANEVYSVSLFKRTEAGFGVVNFTGFSLQLSPSSPEADANLKLLPTAPPPSTGRTIEFLGDSLSCAFGNLGRPGCLTFSANTEDVAKGFVTLAAELLQVDSFHLECWSGKGVVRNYGYPNTTSPDPFPIYFNRSVGNEPNALWNFTSYVPSAVVITLGGNDYSTPPQPSFEQFYQGYSNLLDTVFTVYGPGLQHIFGVCGPLSQDPCPQVQQVVETYNDPRVTFISLANTLNSSDPLDYGCDGHPSAIGDVKVSLVLAKGIQAVLGWD